MRIALFLLTNLAVLVVASIVLSVLQGVFGIQGDTTGLLLFCAVFGMTGALISLLLSKTLARRATRTRLIDPRQPANQREQWLLQTVAELARDAGIRTPEVGIFPAREANAFATGWNRNDALVAVSEGLLQRFSADEVKAVLGHEIGHVANGDMVTLALIQGVINTFVMFLARIIGRTVDQAIFRNERGPGPGYFVTVLITELVLAFLASMIVAWFSRRREFRADAAGARLAGRDSMVAALRRLQAEQGHPSELPDTMVAFGITSGLAEGLRQLRMTHPPLALRIAALQQLPRPQPARG